MAGKCGNCDLCCKLFSIPELDKKDRELCKFYSLESKSCNVYENRCNTCRGYFCFWLIGYLPDIMKPDEINIVFDRFWIANGRVYLVGTTDKVTEKADAICKLFIKTNMSLAITEFDTVLKKIIYETSAVIDEKHFHVARNSGRLVDHTGNLI